MGNFTNIIIIFGSIGLVAGLLVMMSQDLSASAGVTYDSATFFGDYVFSQYDLSTQYVNGSASSNNWNVIKSSLNDSDLPSQQVTGASSSGFQFPDWLQAGFKWITSPVSAIVNGVATPVRMTLNVVGIPYTIIRTLNIDNRAGAVLAGYLSVIISIITVLFVLGREN